MKFTRKKDRPFDTHARKRIQDVQVQTVEILLYELVAHWYVY